MTEEAVRVAGHRLKQQFGALLRAAIAEPVDQRDEVENELLNLIRVEAVNSAALSRTLPQGERSRTLECDGFEVGLRVLSVGVVPTEAILASYKTAINTSSRIPAPARTSPLGGESLGFRWSVVNILRAVRSEAVPSGGDWRGSNSTARWIKNDRVGGARNDDRKAGKGTASPDIRSRARNATTKTAVEMIGIGGHLAMSPLPHHRAYGSVPRRFGRLSNHYGSR